MILAPVPPGVVLEMLPFLIMCGSIMRAGGAAHSLSLRKPSEATGKPWKCTSSGVFFLVVGGADAPNYAAWNRLHLLTFPRYINDIWHTMACRLAHSSMGTSAFHLCSICGTTALYNFWCSESVGSVYIAQCPFPNNSHSRSNRFACLSEIVPLYFVELTLRQ